MDKETELLLGESQNFLIKLTERLNMTTRALESANEKIKEMGPKVEFYDQVANSEDLIEMSEVAKTLAFNNFGRNKIFQLLRVDSILRQNNQPYQNYVDQGYFKLIEQKVELPNSEIKINLKTLVTQKGLDFIRKVIIQSGGSNE